MILLTGYYALANTMFYQGKYHGAMIYYLQADSICTANSFVNSICANVYDGIGGTFSALDNKEKAREYYFRSKSMHEALNFPVGVNSMDLRLAQLMYLKKEYEPAYETVNEVIGFYAKMGNKDSQFMQALRLRGDIYLLQRRFGLAEKDYLAMLEIARDQSDNYHLPRAQYVLGNLYLTKGEDQKALSYYLQSKKIAMDQHDFTLQKDVDLSLVKVYSRLKNREQVINTYKDLLVVNDSINQVEARKSVSELEARYQAEKKEQEIALLRARNELVRQQRNNQLYIFLAITSVVLITAVFLYFLYRNRQKTTRQLRELDKVKSNFFANISHEFRTPLTLIKGPIEGQLSQEGMDENERNRLKLIDRNADRLLSLVDQLLDLSKLEAGNMSLQVQEGSLSSLLNALVFSFQYAADEKKISFNTSIPDQSNPGWFDKDVVEKVVVNLLSNAVKYTPTGGGVHFESELLERFLKLTIRNTGKGIPAEKASKVFERFYQVSDTDEGSGNRFGFGKRVGFIASRYHRP